MAQTTIEQLQASANAANVALAAAVKARDDANTAEFILGERTDWAVPLALFAAGFRATYHVTPFPGGGDWDDWSGDYDLTTPAGETVHANIEPSHAGTEVELKWVSEELTRLSGGPVTPWEASSLAELNERVVALVNAQEVSA